MTGGIFISIEGADGAGKSTQVSLIKEFLEKSFGDREVIFTREPGGTTIGESIRALILDPKNEAMSDMAEALLYAASRAQHVKEVIKPALDAGKIVICDRFIDSSIAYQGYGRKLGDCVRVINEYAVEGVMPDLTIYISVTPEVSKARVMDGRELDRLELEEFEFFERVYDGYCKLEKIYGNRFFVVDGSQTVEKVADEIRAKLGDFLREFK